ncbi:hypothetical protein SFC88_01845 [Nocardioides sp. HM23]|uniref:hypothetical protein n=1 Tax=Nocardioides bizhenqiangii TaxID=3095076 RepID=UPI002ACA2AFB|nr:hypothetical protein [Nocardioides sp. HM23]MDZ5619548.1 hypothetical protein [Nocardioides sp. HM23]
MSTVGTITKLATEVVGKAAHAVTHPRQTVTTVTGHARDLAATVTGGDQKTSTTTGTTETAPEDAPLYESPQRNVEPAEPVPPAESVEPSTTEPKAASREAAHHGRGADPTDDWHDEIEDPSDVGINPATGLPNTGQSDDEPLIDPSVAKSVRSESETMSRAADPDKEEQ